ncbi:hypothetical protein HPB50_003323 [Hyalomma asiaticum]|uniref:Uncharacterized protein n=1 Tax=Hyalomma asiaticum TaxID=266040 RepID=A0ACB7T806_HYAAI|nr:hypothetical protein HPB50_003323 [Hyalomma asiaticum]
MYIPKGYHDWDLAFPIGHVCSRDTTAVSSPFHLSYDQEQPLTLYNGLHLAARSRIESALDAIALAHHARDLSRTRLTTSQIPQRHPYDVHQRDTIIAWSDVSPWDSSRHAVLSRNHLSRYSGPYRPSCPSDARKVRECSVSAPLRSAQRSSPIV